MPIYKGIYIQISYVILGQHVRLGDGILSGGGGEGNPSGGGGGSHVTPSSIALHSF